MINLLPEKEKNELKKQENWKKFFIVLLFFALSLLFLSFFLWGLNYFVRSKADSFHGELTRLENGINNSEFRNFQEETVKINQDLAKINNYFKSQVFIAPIFERLSVLVPDTIYFTSFSLQKKIKEIEEKGKKIIIPVFNIYISGWAKNRSDLYILKEKLEEEPIFENVNFLPNAWVSPKNINFSFTLNYVVQ